MGGDSEVSPHDITATLVSVASSSSWTLKHGPPLKPCPVTVAWCRLQRSTLPAGCRHNDNNTKSQKPIVFGVNMVQSRRPLQLVVQHKQSLDPAYGFLHDNCSYTQRSQADLYTRCLYYQPSSTWGQNRCSTQNLWYSWKMRGAFLFTFVFPIDYLITYSSYTCFTVLVCF